MSASKISKRKVYVDTVGQAPPNVTVEHGPRGGLYYEGRSRAKAKAEELDPKVHAKIDGLVDIGTRFRDPDGNMLLVLRAQDGMIRLRDEGDDTEFYMEVGDVADQIAADPHARVVRQQARTKDSPSVPGQTVTRKTTMSIEDVRTEDVWTSSDPTGEQNKEATWIGYAKKGTFEPHEGLSPERVVFKNTGWVGGQFPQELTTYLTSEALGADQVPEVRRIVEGDGQSHVMRWVDDSGFGGQCQVGTKYAGPCSEKMMKSFVRYTMIMALSGSSDVWPPNWVVDPEGEKIWGIDNGLSHRGPINDRTWVDLIRDCQWEAMTGNSLTGRYGWMVDGRDSVQRAMTECQAELRSKKSEVTAGFWKAGLTGHAMDEALERMEVLLGMEMDW